MYVWAPAYAASSSTAESVFEKVSPSVVSVRSQHASGELSGSGVAIGAGRVATNCHVTQGGRRIDVYAGEVQYRAQLEHVDAANDMCLLAVPGLARSPITALPSASLKVGQRVYAIGNPKGMNRSMSEGIVSALRTRGGTQLIQTTAAISQGSSGGGLFDAQGRLVGITTFKLADGESLNFAISADLLAPLGRAAPAARASGQRKVPLDWRAQVAQESDASAKAELCRQWSRSEPRALDAWRCVLGAELIPDAEKLTAARAAYKLAPHDAAVAVQHGLLLAFQVPKEEEIATLEQLLARPAALSAEQQAQLQLRLGNALSGLGRSADAMRAYERATAQDPKLAKAWERLAVALMEAPQRPAAARAALQKAIRLTPREALLWSRLSHTYVQESQFDDAIAAQRRAIELAESTSNPIADLFPENARARLAGYRVDLAQLYLHLERYDEVLETVDKAVAGLKDTPALEERVRASLYGSASHWKLGNRADAVKMLTEATTQCDDWDPSKAFIPSDERNAGRSALCGSAWYHRALAAQALGDPETVRNSRMRLEILAPALARELQAEPGGGSDGQP
jgi:tetratricopeptide (TPR) repeat protein